MKKLFYLFGLLLIISATFYSCSKDDSSTQIEEEVSLPLLEETFLNVSYGSDSKQVYDIYLPEGRSATTTKVIVLVHGGSWVGGDKEDMNYLVDYIKTSLPKYAIVNMNYVLAEPNITPAFPNQFLDIKSVITQITNQKEELQILPEFALIGTSAGAHLSLIYDFVYDTNDQVKMVGDIVGPTDFTDPFYTNDPLFDLYLEALVDESQYDENTNIATEISPSYQVSQNSSPCIMFYGNQDPLVPLSNAESLEQALTNHNINYSFTVYEGGHGDWDEVSYLNLALQLTEFISENLPIEP